MLFVHMASQFECSELVIESILYALQARIIISFVLIILILSVSQYSIYRTAFGRGPAGLPICYPVGPPDDISGTGIGDISSIGIEGQVKFLYSPRHPEQYVVNVSMHIILL